MKRRAFLLWACIGAFFRPKQAVAQTAGTITNVEIIPNPSGCGHAQLQMQIDGEPFEMPIYWDSFLRETPDEVQAAALNRIRSYIKESNLTAIAATRTSLRLRSFKI